MILLFYGIREKLCLVLNKKNRLPIFEPSVICLAFVFSFLGALGQPKGEDILSPAGSLALSPLSVGDTLPPTSVQVSLPEKGRVTIPQTGKLTLLYFWETRCSSCWGKFPFLDSMRKKYKNRLEIITISPQPQAKIDQLFNMVKKVQGTRLAAVSADTALHQRFPHVLISHVAWIDGSGRVLAITAPDYITLNNIEYVLAGHKPNWQVKADLVKYDGLQPLLNFNKAAGYNVNLAQPEYIFWCNTIPGLENKLYRIHQPDGNRVTFINAAYRTLFSIALNGIPHYPNRYRLPDTMLAYFFKPDTMYSDEWKIRYGTCLEIFLPGSGNNELPINKMKNALEDRFGIVFGTDSLLVPVWEISGSGFPIADRRETVYNRSYDWNFLSLVPIIVDPQTAGAGFKTEPEPKDVEDFKAFTAWCAKNNLSLTATTRKLSMLTFLPKK